MAATSSVASPVATDASSATAGGKIYRARLISHSGDISLDTSKGCHSDGVPMFLSYTNIKDACKALREGVKGAYPILDTVEVLTTKFMGRFVTPFGDCDTVGAIWRVSESKLGSDDVPTITVVADYIMEEFSRPTVTSATEDEAEAGTEAAPAPATLSKLQEEVKKTDQSFKALDSDLRTLRENQVKLTEMIEEKFNMPVPTPAQTSAEPTKIRWDWDGLIPTSKEGKRAASSDMQSPRPTKIAKVDTSNKYAKAEKKRPVMISATHPSGWNVKISMDGNSSPSAIKECVGGLLTSLPSISAAQSDASSAEKVRSDRAEWIASQKQKLQGLYAMPLSFQPISFGMPPSYGTGHLPTSSYDASLASFLEELATTGTVVDLSQSLHSGKAPSGVKEAKASGNPLEDFLNSFDVLRTTGSPIPASAVAHVKPSETSYRAVGDGARYSMTAGTARDTSVAAAPPSVPVPTPAPTGAQLKPKDHRKQFAESLAAGLRAQSAMHKDSHRPTTAGGLNSIIGSLIGAMSVPALAPRSATGSGKVAGVAGATASSDHKSADCDSLQAKNRLKEWYTANANIKQVDWKLANDQGKQIRSLQDVDIRDLYTWAFSRPPTPVIYNLIGYIAQYHFNDMHKAIECYFKAADDGLYLAMANLRDMLIMNPIIRELYRSKLKAAGYAQ